jgi:hypothetical protein
LKKKKIIKASKFIQTSPNTSRKKWNTQISPCDLLRLAIFGQTLLDKADEPYRRLRVELPLKIEATYATYP